MTAGDTELYSVLCRYKSDVHKKLKEIIKSAQWKPTSRCLTQLFVLISQV